jgi:hypothetical protein
VTPGRKVSLVQTVAAIAWAVRVEYVIRRRGLPELCELTGIVFEPAVSSPAGPHQDPTSRLQLSDTDLGTIAAVERVYRRWPIRGTCLRSCLVTGRLLRYRKPTLQIGVRRTDGGDLVAHSWLVVAGHPIDATAAEYARL